MILTPQELHVLCHALGRDDYALLPAGRVDEYRNHYDPGKEPPDEVVEMMDKLVEAGLLQRYVCIGGWLMYRVTDEGRRQAIKQAPPAPRQTQAARRYRKWQSTRDAHGLSFGQWLREGYHIEKWGVP